MSRTPSLRRSPGRPVDQHARAERRAHILAAARRCFLARGFHAASTADISREAGVSVANLYQYFPAKEDLVLAMVEDDLDRDLAFLTAQFEEGPFLDNLERTLAALAEEGGTRVELGLRAEIFAEALRNERVRDALARSEAGLVAALTRAIDTALARGEMALADGVEARDLATIVFALADGVYSGAGLGLLDGDHTAAIARRLVARASAPIAED